MIFGCEGGSKRATAHMYEMPKGALQQRSLIENVSRGFVVVDEGSRNILDVNSALPDKVNGNTCEKVVEAPQRRKVVPKVARTQVTIGMRLKRWIITGRIGAGSFGETFTAIEDNKGGEGGTMYGDVAGGFINQSRSSLTSSGKQEVCIKVELENKNVLRIEAAALKRMQACPQVARYMGSGSTRGMNFLVMQKLGPNLTELRRGTPLGTFSTYTTLMLGISCLTAIRGVHELGLVHRDIKPSNIVIGIGGDSDPRTCYLVDFGLARRYRRFNGELRLPREKAGFRGTSRYASLASHRQQELGRVDDIWSLLFMLIEFATGTLPWRKYKEKEEIGRCKEEVMGPGLVQGLPREFRPFLAHLQTLQYESEPGYDFLLELMEQAIKRRGYLPGRRLDWEFQEENNQYVTFQRGANGSNDQIRFAKGHCGDKTHSIAYNGDKNIGVVDKLSHELSSCTHLCLEGVEKKLKHSIDEMNINLNDSFAATRLLPPSTHFDKGEIGHGVVSVNDVSISAGLSKANCSEKNDQNLVSVALQKQLLSFEARERHERCKEGSAFCTKGREKHLHSFCSETANVDDGFSPCEGGTPVENDRKEDCEFHQPSPSLPKTFVRQRQQQRLQKKEDGNEDEKTKKKKVSFSDDPKATKGANMMLRQKPNESKKILNICRCTNM